MGDANGMQEGGDGVGVRYLMLFRGSGGQDQVLSAGTLREAAELVGVNPAVLLERLGDEESVLIRNAQHQLLCVHRVVGKAEEINPLGL